MTILIACGMKSEQNIINNPTGAIVIQGRNNDTMLRADMETAIANGGIHGLMSIGLSGGLSSSLYAGDIVVGLSATDGKEIYASDPKWMWKLYDALESVSARVPSRLGRFAYSTSTVISAEDKAKLLFAQRAHAVDMETWQVADTALKHNLPWAALRVIVDPADFTLPPGAVLAMDSSGAIDFKALIESVAEEPKQIVELQKLVGYFAAANENLATALLAIGSGVAFSFPNQGS